MQIDYVVLADAAMAVQGKHYLLGAGWDTIFTAGFPLSYPSLGVAVRVRYPRVEIAQHIRVEVDIVGGDGHSILPVPPGPLQATVSVDPAPAATPAPDHVLCLAFTLTGVEFPRAGSYVVVVRVAGGVEAHCPFTVAAVVEATAQG